MMRYTTSSSKLETKKTISFEKLIYRASVIISGLSVFYLISVFFTGYSWLPFAKIDAASSELTLSLVQCVLGIAALHIPMLITKITRIKIPDTLVSIFYIFIICATVLGEVFSLYYVVSSWDSILHFSSGMMAGMLGSILLVNFLQKKKCSQLITPIFIAVYAVCFAIFIGVVWEIYEFVADSVLGLNMQKSLLQSGEGLVGKGALLDTMKDLIVDSLGAISAAVSSFLSIKNEKGWLYSFVSNKLNKEAINIS